MFAHSLNVKQFYLKDRLYLIRCNLFVSELTKEQWQSTYSKVPSLEPNHQIVLCPIQDTRWSTCLTLQQKNSRCIVRPSRLGYFPLFKYERFTISSTYDRFFISADLHRDVHNVTTILKTRKMCRMPSFHNAFDMLHCERMVHDIKKASCRKF